MLVYPGGLGFYIAGQLRHGHAIAFGQLLDAAGQGLADAVKLALNLC